MGRGCLSEIVTVPTCVGDVWERSHDEIEEPLQSDWNLVAVCEVVMALNVTAFYTANKHL